MPNNPDRLLLPGGRTTGGRLLAIFTAALIGYIWGWIWGWSLFDPDLDLWALGAAGLALTGLVAGVLGLFQRHAAAWIASTAGLFLGWYVRTLVFGDHPGGWGLLVLLLGAIAGGWVAHRRSWGQSPGAMRVMVIALYSGFLGGFLIDIVLLDLLFGLVNDHTIQTQAPWVAACAIAGGWLASARLRSGRTSRLVS